MLRWSVPHWPVEWGGTGWDVTRRYIYDEEFGLAGAPMPPPFGPSMCAAVLLRFWVRPPRRAEARVARAGAWPR